jgi:hypothetical protein
MTANGWAQIALFSVIIILLTKPFGGYMTKVFGGERNFLSPVLRPVERAIYWSCGVDAAMVLRSQKGSPEAAKAFDRSFCATIGSKPEDASGACACRSKCDPPQPQRVGDDAY